MNSGGWCKKEYRLFIKNDHLQTKSDASAYILPYWAQTKRNMRLKLSAITALLFALTAILFWEIYWRNKGLQPMLDDDKHLWAQARHKVHDLTSDDIVIVGSSRVLFNIQLDDFENVTGKRPIQLASAGSSPLPIFRDIVRTTSFNGTIIVGVTPGLFFSTTFPGASPMKWPLERVEHYHDRTWASRLNQWLSLPLQEHAVFIAGHQSVMDDNVDLKTLLLNFSEGSRPDKPSYPPFFEFGKIDKDRNVRMVDRVAEDTAQANIIKGAWEFVVKGNRNKPDKVSTINYFKEDVDLFTGRGGRIILVRCPSTGMFKDGEARFLPRPQFFDSLVQVTQLPAYHYADYETLSGFDCPEWSHLSYEDARIFTDELAKIMVADGVITNTSK